MARQTVEDWIPEEWGGAVVTKVAEFSKVEQLARTEPMGTDTKHVPRSAGMAFQGAIAKGSSYPEATGTNDQVLLTARKFPGLVRLADEDIKDTANVANLIDIKKTEWARGYAIGFDNASLGVSAVENGTTIPFTSLYKSLRTTNSAVGYTADANRIVTGGNLDYADLSAVFGLVEGSGYYSEPETIVIAHPAFKAYLRSIVDSHGDPLFVENKSQAAGTTSTLLGAPVYWSLGAKVSATATDTPAGNALMFVGNRSMLIRGVRSGPESFVIDAATGAATLTDEALIKMRSRRAFAVANENAWAVIEKT